MIRHMAQEKSLTSSYENPHGSQWHEMECIGFLIVKHKIYKVDTSVIFPFQKP